LLERLSNKNRVRLRLRINLLGGLSLWHLDRVREPPISRFRTQKTASLLGYLAYHPHREHPREELTEILWPEAVIHRPFAACVHIRDAAVPAAVRIAARSAPSRLGNRRPSVNTDIRSPAGVRLTSCNSRRSHFAAYASLRSRSPRPTVRQ